MATSSSPFQLLLNITSPNTPNTPSSPTRLTTYHSTILFSPQYLFARFTKIMLFEGEVDFHACFLSPHIDHIKHKLVDNGILSCLPLFLQKFSTQVEAQILIID